MFLSFYSDISLVPEFVRRQNRRAFHFLSRIHNRADHSLASGNQCDPDHLQPVNIQEIIAVANKADKQLGGLLKAVIEAI